jgi:ataxia telangiectasia mutated family protein
MPSSRSRAAEEVFSKCLHFGPGTERLNQIDFACTAYLEWAIYPLRKSAKSGEKALSRGTIPDIRLKKILNFLIPVTTAYTPVDFTMKYENLVTINKYASNFRTAGGQALPKIVDCIGSDGKCYVQLVYYCQLNICIVANILQSSRVREMMIYARMQ